MTLIARGADHLAKPRSYPRGMRRAGRTQGWARRLAVLIVALAGAVLLAGCAGNSSGTQPQQRQHLSLRNLNHKISLIQQDPCYTGTPERTYPRCDARYITEVDNITQAALNEAAENPPGTKVRDAANAISKASHDFQTRQCRSQDHVPRCAQALRAVNDGLRTLGSVLPDNPATPTPSG